jgi:DNA (cytosine-5)-methyltransferase 1
MAANDVAPTLTTRCTTPACGSYVHPWEDRGITLREAALLQTFPAGYIFCGGYGAIERQIGNAIPVRLAEAAATAVRALLVPVSEPRLGT